MRKIAVIGLGIMGHGIADNFLKNGYQVYVWNRTPSKAEDLRGAKIVESPKEAAAKADIIFEVTANDESSRGVWLGKEGIITAANPNQYLITCATLSNDWATELAAECAKRNLTFFDMPMTGTRIGAETGQLTLFAGGDKNKLREIGEELKAITAAVKYLGPAGSGMRFKLILNMVFAMHVEALREALALAKIGGLDVNQVGELLAEKPGGSSTQLAWSNFKKPPKPINFSTEWMDKDIKYAKKMAGGKKLPVLEEVIKIFDKAIAEGHDQDDWTGIIKL